MRVDKPCPNPRRLGRAIGPREQKHLRYGVRASEDGEMQKSAPKQVQLLDKLPITVGLWESPLAQSDRREVEICALAGVQNLDVLPPIGCGLTVSCRAFEFAPRDALKEKVRAVRERSFEIDLLCVKTKNAPNARNVVPVHSIFEKQLLVGHGLRQYPAAAAAAKPRQARRPARHGSRGSESAMRQE
eukprot:Amastigsp_a6162_56.p5 type:complete len:187 gc:universal Amastigsp_a6162_56:1336-1896(+)